MLAAEGGTNGVAGVAERAAEADGGEREGMMSRGMKTLLVTLLALVVTYLAAIGLGLIAFDVFDVSQREGAAAMGLVFILAPAAALLGAFVAALWSWRAFGRSKAEAETAGSGRKRGAIRLAVMAAAALGGWMAGTLLQWLLWGRSFEMYLVALVVSEAPMIGAFGAAAATGLLLRRRAV